MDTNTSACCCCCCSSVAKQQQIFVLFGAFAVVVVVALAVVVVVVFSESAKILCVCASRTQNPIRTQITNARTKTVVTGGLLLFVCVLSAVACNGQYFVVVATAAAGNKSKMSPLCVFLG